MSNSPTTAAYYIDKHIKTGSMMYYSLLKLDEPLKKHCQLLWALFSELKTIVHTCSEHAVAQQKFAWWQQEIQSEQPSHPLTQELSHYSKIDAQSLTQLVQGLMTNANYQGYVAYTDVVQHCHREFYAINQIIVSLLAPQDDLTPFTHDLSLCHGLMDIIFNLRQNIFRNAIHLAETDIKKFNLDIDSLYQYQNSDGLTAILNDLLEKARDYYQKALNGLQATQRRNLCSLLVLTELQLKTLDEQASDGFKVMTAQVQLTPLRLLWLSWRIRQRC